MQVESSYLVGGCPAPCRWFHTSAAVYLAALWIWALPGGADAQSAASAGQDVQVEELLARMTLAEKVGQMTLIDLSRLMGEGQWDRGPLSPEWLDRVLVECHVGAVLAGGNAAPLPATPAGWAETAAALQAVARDRTRLGIPLLFGADAVHGHHAAVGATVYPHNLGLAASWDPDLLERVARATAKDARATGVQWVYAPVSDVGRDPRWGRFYETSGEDPLLVSAMVAATVRGLQGEDLGAPASVAATVKHFVGYGGAEAGRDRYPAWIPERALRRVHLPPFQAGIDAGAATLMVDSGSVNGVPVHASRRLLTDLLRGEMGFEGVVVSDWHDIHYLEEVHRIAPDLDSALVLALEAGIDMVMVPHDAEGFTAALIGLVRDGRIAEDRIDESVRRILRLKVSLGLFEEAPPDPEVATRTLHGGDPGLALEAAVASMTLLTNRAALPLSGGSLLLAGPGVDDVAMQLGGWTAGWQGVGGPEEAPGAISLRAGLQELVGTGGQIQVLAVDATPRQLQQVARAADTAIVALGEPPYAEFVGDQPDPVLPAEQAELVRSLAATGTPTVIVLFAGRPLVLPPDVVEAAAAILMAYLPGDQGGSAVAQVLLGQDEPGGRLPFTWPASVGQIPVSSDRVPVERAAEPLFPFGHGLGYGQVQTALGEPLVDSNVIHLTVQVTNPGDRPARDVLLVTVERPATGPVMGPASQLVAFQAIELGPGEARTEELEIPLERLVLDGGDVFDVVEPTVVEGEYRLRLGTETRTVTLPGSPAAATPADPRSVP